jgi:hypothetical protein
MAAALSYNIIRTLASWRLAKGVFSGSAEATRILVDGSSVLAAPSTSLDARATGSVGTTFRPSGPRFPN